MNRSTIGQPGDSLTAALAGAAWISPVEGELPEPGHRPAQVLRQTFTCDGTESDATLAITAHGVYEAFLNGVRIGDEELTPGFSSYRAHLEVRRHDVSDLLVPGENTLAVLLSDGWFRGRHGFQRRADSFGSRIALLASITGTAATETLVATDDSWQSRPSHITRADLMDGQAVDMRLLDYEWFSGGGTGWRHVEILDDALTADRSRLIEPWGPPVRATETFSPVRITRPRHGTAVIDLGQDINGWMRLTDLGPAGTHLTLTHGETLDRDGLVTMEHLQAFDFSTGAPLSAGQVDEVISAGREGDVFEPRHTTHGFRYAQVDGVPEGLNLDGALGVMVETVLEGAGSFQCSDQRLNALHEAVRWSLRGNACSIPTDCPQRERSGFTGDWQIFVATGALLFDVDRFSRRWLQSLADDQWADGRVPTVIPNPPGNVPSGVAFEDMSAGSAGWGDAAAMVPWELWRAYGDADAVAEQLPAALDWVRYAARAAASGRHPDRAAARPEPREYETFLWDTGFHFGEWLAPGEEPNPDPTVDHGIVATAYLHRSAHLTALLASLVGDHDSASECRRIASGARDAWRAEYLHEDGTLTEESQGHYTRALAFGLIPEPLRRNAAARLAALIAEAGEHLGTGFLSTGMLLPALADNGQEDLAFRLLTSTGHPSWLGMLEAGATTMWEWWDGVDENGIARGSLNHYSKGAVASFLYTHIAGVQLPEEPSADETAYRRVRIAPAPGPELTSAGCALATRQGDLEVAWEVEDGTFTLRLALPDTTAADVELPDGSTHALVGGTHTLRCGLVRA